MGILHSMVQLLLEKWDTRGKKNKPKHLRHTSKTGVSFGRKEKKRDFVSELSSLTVQISVIPSLLLIDPLT